MFLIAYLGSCLSFMQQEQLRTEKKIRVDSASCVFTFSSGLTRVVISFVHLLIHQAVAPAPGGQQTYDPLSIFGAPSSPPQQPQFQAQQEQQQQYHGQQQQLNPYVEQTQQFNVDEHRKQSVLPDEIEDEGLALVDVELDEDSIGEDPAKLEIHKKDGEYFGGTPRNHDDERRNTDSRRSSSAQPWDRNPDIAPPPPRTPGRHHSEYLAQNSAPALSSPLPNPSLVHHSGYVLSRISFRTVLMRKWKQTFWIQYGPTQVSNRRTKWKAQCGSRHVTHKITHPHFRLHSMQTTAAVLS